MTLKLFAGGFGISGFFVGGKPSSLLEAIGENPCRNSLTPPQASARPPPASTFHPSINGEETAMLDFMMLAIGLGFFALALGYLRACEWL